MMQCIRLRYFLVLVLTLVFNMLTYQVVSQYQLAVLQILVSLWRRPCNTWEKVMSCSKGSAVQGIPGRPSAAVSKQASVTVSSLLLRWEGRNWCECWISLPGLEYIVCTLSPYISYRCMVTTANKTGLMAWENILYHPPTELYQRVHVTMCTWTACRFCNLLTWIWCC